MKTTNISVGALWLSIILAGCEAQTPEATSPSDNTVALAAAKATAPEEEQASLAPTESWQGYPWPPDGDLTGTAALAAMLPIPTDKGNACEDYMKLTALEGEALPYPDLEVTMNPRDKRQDAESDALKKAASDPEVIKRLEVLRAGAQKASCQTFGALYPWVNKGNPLEWKMPQYPAVMMHAAVAEQHAWNLAKAGKLDEAIAWLHDLIIVGWHLQQDVTLLSNMIGVKISSDTATSLSMLLKTMGTKADTDTANAWRGYSGLMLWRRHVAYKGLIGKILTTHKDDVDTGLPMVIDVARSNRMMRGVRTEAILAVALANVVRPGAPPASELQKKVYKEFMDHPDAGLAAAAKAFSYILELPQDGRASLALEIAKK